MRMINLTALVLAVLVALAGCRNAAKTPSGGSHDGKSPAVHVENPQAESKLTTVTLSESARTHLDIQTVPVRREKVQAHRTYGGEVVVPEGRSIIISAPMSGTITASDDRGFPRSGAAVDAGDMLFELTPSIRGRSEVLNPTDRIALARARADLEAARVQAAGDVESAGVRIDVTQIALERAEKLVSENAGSVRSLDEARADHRLARTALEAANARKKVLDETLEYLSCESEGSALPISAPFAGVVQRLLVAEDGVVAAGAPLCEITARSPLWVRVSPYVGDLQTLTLNMPAVARRIGATESQYISLQPVSAPTTGNPVTSSLDLYYELDNSAGIHQPGERLIVSVPIAGAKQSLVIPRLAILYDIHGDAWVYVASNDNTFVRHRVSIRRISGDVAEIASGVEDGDLIVTQGAAELFGAEFGTAGH